MPAATAPTVEGLVASTRNMLRDFPIFFEIDLGPLTTSTLRLPHPLVDARTIQVYSAAQPGPDSIETDHLTMEPVPDVAWDVDERNGLLKFSDSTYAGRRIFVAAYHYEWFLESDLAYYAALTVSEHFFQRADASLDTISPLELDVIAIGAVALVRASRRRQQTSATP